VKPATQTLAAPPASLSSLPAAESALTTGGRLRIGGRQLRVRLMQVWLPRAAWSIAKTGRCGLVGLALMGSCMVFWLSTYLPISRETSQLRLDLTEAKIRAALLPSASAASVPRTAGNLPKRAEMPDVLAVVLRQADAAQLSIDTAKYEVSTAKGGAVVRYQVSFPVTGPYPNVRQFIDATLSELPALALEELSIQRKSIADQSVTAQIRMTVFTRGAS